MALSKSVEQSGGNFNKAIGDPCQRWQISTSPVTAFAKHLSISW
jgi:hypothetical protein